MEKISYFYMIPYGLVEKMVFAGFVLIFSRINFDWRVLFAVSGVNLALTLIIRQLVHGNHLLLILLGVVLSVAVTWIFTGIINHRTWVGSAIAMVIIIMVEYPVMAIGVGYLPKDIDFTLLWLITGIPHILVLFIIAAAMVSSPMIKSPILAIENSPTS